MKNQANNDILVSVIIRTYNRPILLRKAIESVFKQTYSNIQIVVVNDHGQDVQYIIDEFKKKTSRGKLREFTYITNATQLSRAGAANVGIKNSKGKIIGLLDDDDYYLSNHIALHVASQLKNKKNVSISLSNELLTAQNIMRPHFDYTKTNKLNFLFFQNYYPINSVMFNRLILRKVGLFDNKLKVLEDWDFFIRLMLKYDTSIISKITSVYTTQVGTFNVRNQTKEEWKKNYILLRKRYKKTFKRTKTSIPLSEVADSLNDFAIKYYREAMEFEELRDSLIYRAFKSPIYNSIKTILKKITR
ncbi:MAG: glycosyltransferase family A protein [Microgenomates group bacterium]